MIKLFIWFFINVIPFGIVCSVLYLNENVECSPWCRRLFLIWLLFVTIVTYICCVYKYTWVDKVYYTAVLGAEFIVGLLHHAMFLYGRRNGDVDV